MNQRVDHAAAAMETKLQRKINIAFNIKKFVEYFVHTDLESQETRNWMWKTLFSTPIDNKTALLNSAAQHERETGECAVLMIAGLRIWALSQPPADFTPKSDTLSSTWCQFDPNNARPRGAKRRAQGV